MPCKDIDNYRAKHPPGTVPDPTLASAAAEAAQDGQVTCEVAHGLASELRVAPREIGKTLDLLDIRITRCQMGLFGYSPDKKIVRPAETLSEELGERLQNATCEGKVSCAACWEAATALGMQKITIAAACEKLNLKIGSCQLGAF